MGRHVTRFLFSAVCGIVGFFVSFAMAAEDCSDLRIQLQDSDGAVATITESYDCWHEEGANNCRSINSFPGRLRLTGSRVHRVIFLGKEYSFVEATREGGEKYVLGAFDWNEDDVFDFIKITADFVFSEKADIKFEFRKEGSLNRAYGIEIPEDISGKTFIYLGC